MGRFETDTNLSTALVSIEMAKLACVCMLLVLGVHIGPGATSNVASQGSDLEHMLVKRNVEGVKKGKKASKQSIKRKAANKDKRSGKSNKNLKQGKEPPKKGKERTGSNKNKAKRQFIPGDKTKNKVGKGKESIRRNS